MAEDGIEHSSLPLGPHPRPRLLHSAFDSVLEDSPVRLVMLGVHVRLVPTFESLVPLHDRMVGRLLGWCDTERARPVTAELSPHDRDVFRRVLKAVAGC